MGKGGHCTISAPAFGFVLGSYGCCRLTYALCFDSRFESEFRPNANPCLKISLDQLLLTTTMSRGFFGSS